MASGLSAKTGTGAKVNGSQTALDLEAVGQRSPQLHSGKGDVIPLYRCAAAVPQIDCLPWRAFTLGLARYEDRRPDMSA